MDAATASVIVAAIASLGTVAAAAIGAMSSNDRAVAKATAPLTADNHRLRELVISLGGDPDAPA